MEQPSPKRNMEQPSPNRNHCKCENTSEAFSASRWSKMTNNVYPLVQASPASTIANLQDIHTLPVVPRKAVADVSKIGNL